MKKTYISRCLAIGVMLLSLHSSAQTTYSYTGALQTYTVPSGVTSISIETRGGQGGDAANGGGLGAIMIGTFAVTPGQVLDLLVGGEGVVNVTSGNQGGSGGGGSFVVDQGTGSAMLVAGGGGGGCFAGPYSTYGTAYNAAITDAQLGVDGATTTGGAGGGTGGNGGAAGATDCCLTGNIGGSGGGGFLTDGMDGSPGTGGQPAIGGKAYVNGGAGGACGAWDGSAVGSGGYGGGGGSAMDNAFRASGGGGYSGGQGASYINSSIGYLWGGGGGSLNTGTAQVNSIGNTGNGQIIITELCMGLVTSVSATDVCEGETVTLSASSTGTGTVTWDGGVADGVPFAPPVGTTTYTATSDDPADCGFSVDITVNALPTVDAGADIDACEGDLVTLSGSGTADTYTWDGGVSDGVAFTPASGTTTFTVTGTVTATGCENTDVVDVNYTVVDDGVTVTGAYTLTSDQAGATYQWIDCVLMTDYVGETNQSITPTQNGSYAVVVTLNGCIDTSACDVIIDLATEVLENSNWTLYPNPATTYISIVGKGSFDFELVNVMGQTTMSGKKSSGQIIELANLPSGVYFVHISGEFATGVYKIVKQ